MADFWQVCFKDGAMYRRCILSSCLSFCNSTSHWWSYVDSLIYYQGDANAQPGLDLAVYMGQTKGPCPSSLSSMHRPWTEAGEDDDRVAPGSRPKLLMSLSFFPPSFRVLLSLPHSADYIQLFRQKHMALFWRLRSVISLNQFRYKI